MTALEFLKYVKVEARCIPMHLNGTKPQEASNGQMRRWLDMGAVRINEKTPKWNEEIEFPIWDFVFFPKSKNRVSIHRAEQI